MNKRGKIFNIITYTTIIFTIIISLLPILWVIMSSFKTNSEIFSGPFSLPSSLNTSGYKYVLENYNFGKYLVNSILVSVSSTLISLLIYSMAAYVFAKYDFKFKNLLYSLFVITLLVPAQAKTQPIFNLLTKLKLNNTLLGLTFVYISLGMAMSLFILRAAFESVPNELNEAATIDGATFWQKFWKINVPLAKNGMATAGIMMFLNNWNEYFFASLLNTSEDVRTLPVALQFFNESFSYDYTQLFSALTLIIIPGILIYAFAADKIQQSYASSGVKG